MRAGEDEELIDDDVDDGVEAAETPSDEELKEVRRLAQQYADLEDEIAELGRQLAAKQLALKGIREGSLPLALTTIGMKRFELIGGGEVELKTMVAASITEARKPEAHAWLEKNGHGGMIKHEIKIMFGKDEDAWAKKFLADLAKRKKPLRFERKDAVNPQTLGAFVRKTIADATARGLSPEKVLPLDLLGVFQMRYAEVVRPKREEG